MVINTPGMFLLKLLKLIISGDNVLVNIIEEGKTIWLRRDITTVITKL